MQNNLQFKIVVAYENLSAALRARQMCERLAVDLRHEGGIHCALWKFDLLGEPALIGQATEEAAAAGMVIFSANSTALPARVRNWVEGWPAATHQNRAALVVLLDDAEEKAGHSAPITTYVREIARARHADFFCKAGGWWNRDLEPIGDFFNRRPPHGAARDATRWNYQWPGWAGNNLYELNKLQNEHQLKHGSIKQIKRPGFPRTNGAASAQTLGAGGPA